MYRVDRRTVHDSRFVLLLTVLATLLTLAYLAGAHRILTSWNPDLKDYQMWYDHILQNGRWRSLNGSFASYNPPYIYVLSLASNLNGLLGPVTVLKLLNVPFILASGLLAFSICRALGYTRQHAAIAGWLLVAAPEIVMNALVWGQTDILETTFVLLFVRLLLGRRPGLAMAAAGIALSFKLQVIFLGPAIVALLLTRALPVWSLLAAAGSYLAMLLPAELAGRSYKALFGIYSAQTGTADRLSMGAANLYSLVTIVTGNEHVDAAHPSFLWIERIGVVFGAVVSVVLIRYLVRSKRLLSGRDMILALAISALAEPFLLPKMHDRYFYIGDVLVLVLGLIVPRLLIPAVLLQLSAMLVYGRYLIGFHVNAWYYILPMILNGVAIGFLLREFQKSSDAREPTILDEGALAYNG